MQVKKGSISTLGPFDLQQTLNSGQVFHWSEHTFQEKTGFIGAIGETPTFISQVEPETLFTIQQGTFVERTLLDRETPKPLSDPTGYVRRTNPVRSKTEVADYLGLDLPLSEIRATFPQNDPFLDQAINFCPGLRMLRQPTWECLATFITSSLKQVAHIRDISLTLRRRFGQRHDFLGETLYSYPDPEAIVLAGEDALRQCALGYRAKSLFLTAKAIASGELDLKQIETISDNREARDFLLQFHGVGEKIANCVLLFGCGRIGAFPIDVWIERVLRKGYRKRVKGEKLQRWAESYFGPYAGFAQQFLFHYARVGDFES